MKISDREQHHVLVVGICGSLRPGSYTRMAVNLALQGAQQVGARTQLIDLRDYQLAFCHGGDAGSYHTDVSRLRNDVGQAQGIILGTPEYHGGVSGVLKNAIDLMGFSEFEGKMIGMVGVSGGALGAVHALNALRVVGRALHAWIVPEQASVPSAWKHFDDKGNLKDEDLRDRLLEVGKQVARFAYLHTAEESQKFLSEWEAAPVNPGGY